MLKDNLTLSHFKRYHGHSLKEFKHLTDEPYKSYYNHNYYEGLDGDIFYVSGNSSEGYLVALLVDEEFINFADSYDDIIEVFPDKWLRDIIENGAVYC